MHRLTQFLQENGVPTMPGALLDRAPIGATVVDRSGALVWQNSAATEVFRGDFRTVSVEDWRLSFGCLEDYPPYSPIPLDELPGSVALRGHLAHARMRFRTAGMEGDAARIGVPVHLICQPIYATTGRVVGVLSLFWTVTDDTADDPVRLLLHGAKERLTHAQRILEAASAER